MPLNIKDQEQQTDSSEPQPILHSPSEDRTVSKRLVLILFVIAVVGAAAFLVYTFALREGRRASTPETTISEPVESPTLGGQATESPIQTMPQQREASKPTSTGNYTIYIASYQARTVAAEEVQRWNEAGFQAFVIDTDGYHRVALGEYAGYSKARQTAEQLQDGFEYGYWIGTLE